MQWKALPWWLCKKSNTLGLEAFVGPDFYQTMSRYLYASPFFMTAPTYHAYLNSIYHSSQIQSINLVLCTQLLYIILLRSEINFPLNLSISSTNPFEWMVFSFNIHVLQVINLTLGSTLIGYETWHKFKETRGNSY